MSFKLAGTTLTNQPSRVQVVYPGVSDRRLIDGGRIVVVSNTKRTIRATWGVTGARQAAINELRTKRTASTMSLTYDDVDGTETTVTSVYFPQVGVDTPPGGDGATTRYSNPLTLEFLEL